MTELDEITKRLQSRLSDVTNTAFEDDFDNDFDMIEPNSDNENTDDKNMEITPQNTNFKYSANSASQMQNNVQSERNFVNDEGSQASAINSNHNSHFESSSDQVRVINSDATDTGYCTDSNARFAHLGYYHNQNQNRCGLSTRNYLSSSSTEYPARGTKTHINHLLDKLSLDLPPRPSTTAIPMRRDILELFASLRENKNNSQDKNKNNRGIDTCSVPTQTDDLSKSHAYIHATNLITIDGESFPKSSQILESQPRNRISTVIREELVAEENNENSNCDELTTYLITSNVRHMDLDNIFNPLLYQHLLPDLQATAAVSPEGEAEQLDNQYARSFDMAVMRDSRIDRSTENKITPSRNDVPMKSRTIVLDSEENAEEFSTLTDSDVSGNIDNSINVTVIYKSNNNDLMSDNSAESIIDVTSFDKSSAQQIDTKTRNYCSTELSIPGVSRQAPEGGNPVEEAKIVSVMKNRQDDIQDVSADD